MGERKVLNKYYPPDFDPTLLPKGKGPKDQRYTVRMMMPMSVQCTQCGEFIYRGKKFNSLKETVQGEDYLGIRIFRFLMKCTRCSSQFSIKTDPKNADYTAERNCVRTFEPWRASDNAAENDEQEAEENRDSDVMAALEHRTRESKAEMEIMDGLDEIRALNARNSRLSAEQLLEAKRQRLADEAKPTDDLRAEAAAIFAKPQQEQLQQQQPASAAADPGTAVASSAGAPVAAAAAAAADDDDDAQPFLDDLDRLVAQKKREKEARAAANKRKQQDAGGAGTPHKRPALAAKPARSATAVATAVASSAPPKSTTTTQATTESSINLFGDYGDSSSSSD